MYYIQIVQFNEPLFCLIYLVFANFLKTQFNIMEEASTKYDF